MSVWLAGHSLGGALASLIALTNDLPSFSFESPGDLLYAERIGLLPDLPSDGDPSKPPDWTDFLKTLPIWHYGNTQDPIYLGLCNGPSSSCYWFDYALETGCHVGHECIYDENAYNKTISSSSAVPRRNETLGDDPVKIETSVRAHTIAYVLKTFLETWEYVPECKVKPHCNADECSGWKFVD
ncbi:putative lipase atg15 [Borealophlyctis nickersoniae]|nr:putative lipase atg15 [Borealophlyctis nickersoniae]